MPDRLDELAERFGIAEGYISEKGNWITTPAATKAKVLEAMGVPVGAGAGDAAMPEPPPADDVASLSASAFWPPFLVDQRSWGLSVQAYALRSSRNWGIGDFEDLARLAEYAASLGADFIGVSRCTRCSWPTPRASAPIAPRPAIFSIRS
ncbi:hypothetical protein AUC69_15115 [Methyloceanibacter superfactus]|uniref:4-alpha-glucanotransferase n=1 Tax=Methyloceanibacter superfactus TaxID=1774969 RepID=A0A1E3VT18_9HYPH|nr:hypothetical protein [Methyloceanibacter superfactus]ODR96106.1 hypothetical protein AUC69_15115 [Methyloceanibacter superfactus]